LDAAYSILTMYSSILSPLGGRLGHVHFFSLIPHITWTNSSFQATSARTCSTVHEHPKTMTILSGEWFDPESCRIGLDGNEVALDIRGQVSSQGTS
jgi:hypothetical protein